MNDFDDLVEHILLREGLLDRAKAKLSGAKQKASNLMNKGKEAVGKVTNNQDMVSSAQQSQQTTTGQAKAGSLKKSLVSKVNKELTNFITNIQKATGTKSTGETLKKLKEISPDTMSLYTKIYNLSQRLSK